MASHLIEYMKDRDTALKKASRTKDPVDKRNAKKARNIVNSLIRRAKNDFIKEKLENYSDNPKKFWEQVKIVMPTTNLSNQIVLQDENGHKLKNCESANLINKYFSNIGFELANTIQNTNHNINIPPYRPARIIDATLTLIHIEILSWVKRIQVYKSSGLPLISSRIWKILFTYEPALLFTLVETIFSNFNFFSRLEICYCHTLT